MAVFWKNHLKEVDFSENALKEVPLGLFQLDVSTVTLHSSLSAWVRKITLGRGESLGCFQVCETHKKKKVRDKFAYQKHARS